MTKRTAKKRVLGCAATSAETTIFAARLVAIITLIGFTTLSVLIGCGALDDRLPGEVAARALSNVQLPGRLPAQTMPGIFARAHALLVPLRSDETMELTIPSKAQIYLAAGRPIVASMDGEGARTVAASRAEVVCPASDASALATAVGRLRLAHLGLERSGYFVVSSYREENVDDPARLTLLFDILNGLAAKFKLPVIASTHPRTRKRIEALGAEVTPPLQFHKPFGFLDYVRLQSEARCTLSDSGTITEESSILNFPALNLREVHERPEGFEEAAVMMVGLSWTRIEPCLDIVAAQPRGDERQLRPVNDYAPANVSDKVLRILMGYADCVNRRTWHK